MINLKKLPNTYIQFIKYIAIGLISNALSYLIFLILIYKALEPKAAATTLYLFCFMLSFYGNHRITFNQEHCFPNPLMRYALSYLLGYGLNMILLMLFVDYLHYPAYIVQAAAIVFVAGFLFLLLKFFVFSTRKLQ